MAVMRIPYIDTSHAIPYPYLEQSVTKRSAGISKFDQAKGADFNFDLLQKFWRRMWGMKLSPTLRRQQELQ